MTSTRTLPNVRLSSALWLAGAPNVSERKSPHNATKTDIPGSDSRHLIFAEVNRLVSGGTLSMER
jgi:hypothetical protein